MTSDGDDIVIDLTDGWHVPDAWAAEVSREDERREGAALAAARRSRDRAERDRAEHYEPRDASAREHVDGPAMGTASSDTSSSGESQGDPDFSAMNEYQREAWAAEEDISRAERRRRLGLVIDWDREHAPDPGHLAAERSGWADVPLGSILDDIVAGTLVLPKPEVGMLADGSAGLFYAGRVNGLAGESGAGKGWIALRVAAEQMRLGRHTFYLDFEDSPALALLRLVRVLGVDPALLRSRFHYVHPQRHDDDGIVDLVERVRDAPGGGAFVVIDSTGESIAAAGLHQNHDEEVARWMQSLAHPLADEGGACVLLLDHMTKSEDGGLWPIGSQRKRAAITGAQYVAEVAQPFSKKADGMVALRVAKDRHGAHDARSVASFVQFRHPIESTTTAPDGTVEIVLSERLSVHLGPGRTADQAKADKAAKAAAALDADVVELDQLTPPPKSQRDVMARSSAP